MEFEAPQAYGTWRRCRGCYLGVCRVSFRYFGLISSLPSPNPTSFLATLRCNLSLSLHAQLPPCHKSQLTFPHCRWIARVGKAEALAAAGVTLPPSDSEDVNGVPEVIQKNQGAVKVVAFNVVSVAAYFCSSHWRIICGFLPRCLSSWVPTAPLTRQHLTVWHCPNDNDSARPKKVV